MYAGCYKNITVSKMGCARICFLLVWVRILVLIHSINTTLSWEKRLRRYPAPNGRHVLGKSYSKLRSQKLHRRVLEHIMKDDKYKEEIHLDLRSIYLRSEYPLQIHIDKGNRAVSGRFFNLHNHKPTFKLLAEDQETVLLTGGSLTAPYVMDQFHFHVYCTRAEAEQHTLDGSQVPGELHLVFFRKKYKKYSKAVHRFQDGLVAIAIPLEVKEEGYETKNPQIGKFASLVDYISRNENHTVATTASLKQLATPVFHKDAQYHAYRGNLVEPIQCHDCVDVFLTKEPITISVNQITEFRKAPHCVENDWEF